MFQRSPKNFMHLWKEDQEMHVKGPSTQTTSAEPNAASQEQKSKEARPLNKHSGFPLAIVVLTYQFLAKQGNPLNCPLSDPQAADRIAVFLKKKGTNAEGSFDWIALGRQSCKCFSALPRISCTSGKKTKRCMSKAPLRKLRRRNQMQQSRNKKANKLDPSTNTPAFRSPLQF